MRDTAHRVIGILKINNTLFFEYLFKVLLLLP